MAQLAVATAPTKETLPKRPKLVRVAAIQNNPEILEALDALEMILIRTAAQESN